LNPRPKIIHLDIYILIPNFIVILKVSFRRDTLRTSPLKFHQPNYRQTVLTIPLVDALIGCAGEIRQDVGFKQPKRSYNRLRLCLFPAGFTS
jgi:hypothetical protein